MFFSNSHKILTKLDHILGHNTHFNKFKIIGVPVMSQWFMNPTRNDEVVGSIPGLA